MLLPHILVVLVLYTNFKHVAGGSPVGEQIGHILESMSAPFSMFEFEMSRSGTVSSLCEPGAALARFLGLGP